MEENIEYSELRNEEGKGFILAFIWQIKGLYFPCFSMEFYRTAVMKRVFTAAIFFLFFAVLLSTISTIQVAVAMFTVGSEINYAYENDELPAITIKNGTASVSGNQPYIYSGDGTFVGVDTTGLIKEIDNSEFGRGFLLTKNHLHMVNQNGYQVYPLSEMNSAFGNPIVIDKETVLKFWGSFSVIGVLAAAIVIFLWNFLIKLAYIAFIGLFVWGIISLFFKEKGFAPVIITGIYASVPTVYLTFLLGKLGFGFFGFYTIVLVAFWFIVLRSIFNNEKENSLTDGQPEADMAP